jgi:hypothetical protein
MTIRHHLNTLFLLVLLGAAAAADAQVQPQLAERYARRARLDAARMAGAPPGGRVERERPCRSDRRCAGLQTRASPSFVGNFEAASGPAYGVLLDDLLPGWRRQVRGTPAA